MWSKIYMTIFFFLLVIFNSTSATAQTWIKSGYWFTGSEFPVPNINSALFTHLICAFSYIDPLTHELVFRDSDEPYAASFASTVKKTNPSVIPLLSIWTQNGYYGSGNNENSSSFFSMVQEPAYRRSFIESSIKTATRYGFEGLDLFATKLLNTKGNITNLGTFFDEWRIAMDKEKLILTMGGHFSPELGSMSYPVDSVSRNFDWVHIRSYDYHTPFTDNITSSHAALYDPRTRVSTDYGVNEWVKRGLPVNKMVIGLAYHGYAWTLVDPKDGGIGAPGKGVAITKDGSVSYEYVKKYMKSYGVKSEYNSSYVMNYCVIGSFWIGFDDVEAVRTKVGYAKKKGLLGYNVWQVANDYNWELSKAAGMT